MDMSQTSASRRVFISAAEQSADEHAAEFIRAARQAGEPLEFAGLAGPAMRAAGCECFHDLTGKSAMALAALGRVPSAAALLWRLRGYLSEGRFDAAVVVDSPALHLPVAKMCRRRGIPVLYYIAPQTWAWGPKNWRNRRIRARVDRLACIWPFEEGYFREHGIAATYVGHPSFDRLLITQPDADLAASLRENASPVIALLPGSRRHVIEEVLPGQLEVASALAIRYRRARFVVVAAGAEPRSLIESLLAQSGFRADHRLVEGPVERATALTAADLALVASGTVTLEVAYRATPMIVMYNTNRWTYNLIGRWLITTPYFSIPNILAGRRVVPEFMPYYRSTDPIIAQAVEWLSAPGALERIRHELRAAVQPIVKRGAAANAARELIALIGERSRDDRDQTPAGQGAGGGSTSPDSAVSITRTTSDT